MLILQLLVTDTQTFKCNSPLILTKPESVAESQSSIRIRSSDLYQKLLQIPQVTQK